MVKNCSFFKLNIFKIKTEIEQELKQMVLNSQVFSEEKPFPNLDRPEALVRLSFFNLCK